MRLLIPCISSSFDWKIRLFRSFQMFQYVAMHSQSQFLRSLLESNCALFVYQCWYAVDSYWGVLGAQMLCATVQCRNRWLDISMICNLHMTHVVRCSRPFFSRFCCVSMLFCSSSQRNIFTFSGTHIFHKVMSVRTPECERKEYADFTVKYPCSCHLQTHCPLITVVETEKISFIPCSSWRKYDASAFPSSPYMELTVTAHGESGFFSSHNHFSKSEMFCVLRLVMPDPPCLIGREILLQLTRQCPPKQFFFPLPKGFILNQKGFFNVD
jgi:hypothetical protein